MYIRFGELPEGGMSKIWSGDVCLGEEEGVSVYDAKIDDWGNVSVCVPLPVTRDTLDTFLKLIRYDDRPCYLVKGTYVGKGRDNEPLIKDVEIVGKIRYRGKIAYDRDMNIVEVE